MTHAPNYTEAAIRLRIPASGDPKLDAMIRQARRLDIATAAIGGLLANAEIICSTTYAELSEQCLEIADAMLSHREKEQEPTDAQE